MMILDTHTLIWLIEGDPRIGRQTRQSIDRARAGDGAHIAAITLWETAMLVSKNKLALSRAVQPWFDAVLSAPGFRLAPITPIIGVDAGSLSGNVHGDPADRLIIATARALGCPLMTADHKILAYAANGHVQAIDASL